MKILITGVAGLIGSHLSRYLINKKYEVHGVDDLSGGYIENIPDNLYFYPIDLTDHNKVDNLFIKEKFDAVYHFAAYAAEGLSRYILRHNCNSNILSSMNVINACVSTGVKRLIFTSSMAVYGDQKPPYTEDLIPHPDDPYGSSKYFVEMILQQTNKHFGLEYAILRPHNVVGIYQNIWDRYRNVLGIWIRNVLNHEPITIFGDGLQTRAFSDIKYCLEPFEKLLTTCGGEIFNIGSDNFYTIKDVADIFITIAKKHGYTTSIEHRETRNEIKHAYCDHTKIKSMLDFKDETDIDSIIEEMFLWSRTQPDREVKKLSYEIEKNMYKSWS